MTFVDDAQTDSEAETEKVETAQPLFRIYEKSRIPVGKSIGKMFQKKYLAAQKAYEHIYSIWEEAFKYYNNDQSRTIQTTRGIFRRGDGTDNIVFSNLNVMLPAIYSKNPDITCTTTDAADEGFCESLQVVLNVLFHKKNGLNTKPKVKKAAGMALLTNFGVVKLDFTKKADSREQVISEMERIGKLVAKASAPMEAERLYGELEALEQNIEVYEPSGFKLKNVLPHNLTVDPYAEEPDGLDAAWMAEDVMLPTQSLTALYTKPSEDSDPEQEDPDRVLVYKPTHKARFDTGGDRDDGLGIVMDAIDGAGNSPESYTETERTAYIHLYYTACVIVWDKIARRVFLFQKDDWSWPIWVWDDPLNITRFYPYFITAFAMSTGGTVSPGEVAYVLDQQDEINDINRQKSRIRRSVFDFFYYNSDAVEAEVAEEFVKALRGVTPDGKHLIGVKAGDKKVSEIIEAVVPPAAHMDVLFDKAPVMETVNRIMNISDALRGVQFKTNTNVAAVNTYQDSMRLSVGSKVDAIEDTIADLALAVAELSVQNLSNEDVADLVGAAHAEAWQQMDLATFNASYTVEVVAGSMEKPNSTFKKKEAVEVTQALGQFAQAAPGTTLKLMLKVISKAFTEVVVKDEDWAALDAEITANLQAAQAGPTSGSNLPAAGGGGGSGAPPPQAQLPANNMQAQAANLPDRVKRRIMEMRDQGIADSEIAKFIVAAVQKMGAHNGAT